MGYCPKCGAAVTGDSEFCGRCGAPLGQGVGHGGTGGVTRSNQVTQLRAKHRRLARIWLAFIAVGAIILVLANPGVDLLFLLAVAPGAYLVWHFHHADKYKEESTRLLLGTFVLGALSTIPAILIEVLDTPASLPDNPVFIFLYFLLGVGLVEEGVKFLSVRGFAYRSPHFDEAMDGIIFGITAALGFATVENIGYVLQYGVVTAFVRAFVSVPGHAFWGAIWGYFLAESKVQRKPMLAAVGLGIAVFLHGLFDTVATIVPNPVLGLVILGGLVWVLYFRVVKKEIAKAQQESLYAPGRPGQ